MSPMKMLRALLLLLAAFSFTAQVQVPDLGSHGSFVSIGIGEQASAQTAGDAAGIAASAKPAAIFAPTKASTELRVPLESGADYVIPKGYFNLKRVGPFIVLQQWSQTRQVWENTENNQATGRLAYSDGLTNGPSSWRLVNLMNTVVSARLTAQGTGYTQGNVSASLNNTMVNGLASSTPQFNVLVGGGIYVTAVTNGGLYSIPPTVLCSDPNQTYPYLAPQLDPRLNSSGAITGFNLDTPPANGAVNGSSSVTTGAHLNAATLTCVVQRSSQDAYTDSPNNTATFTFANGDATQVTAVLLTKNGGAYGNNIISGKEVVTASAGSGFTWSAVGNAYVTGYSVTDGGVYLNAYSARGTLTAATSTVLTDSTQSWAVNTWAGYFVRFPDGLGWEVGKIVSNTATALTVTQVHPTTAATLTDIPAVGTAYEIASGVTSSRANGTYLNCSALGAYVWDEIQRVQTVPEVGVLTAGVLTSISSSGVGPGYQGYPVVSCLPQGGVWTTVRQAQATVTIGNGGDYATIQLWGQFGAGLDLPAIANDNAPDRMAA